MFLDFLDRSITAFANAGESTSYSFPWLIQCLCHFFDVRTSSFSLFSLSIGLVVYVISLFILRMGWNILKGGFYSFGEISQYRAWFRELFFFELIFFFYFSFIFACLNLSEFNILNTRNFPSLQIFWRFADLALLLTLPFLFSDFYNQHGIF